MQVSLNWLKKKLSIGLSFGYLSADENISIIEKYANYIHDVYFSPVESLRLQTRLKIYDFDNTTQETRRIDLNKVLAVAKSKGIKIAISEDNGCVVDISILVKYGYDIKEVAQNLQQNIKNTIESMAQLEIKSVNVLIDGIVFDVKQETKDAE